MTGRRAIFSTILATAIALGLATAGEALAQTRPTLIVKGRQLLDRNCSRCHAIGPEGASTHAKAPPFRDVMKKYPAESLAEALAEGIVSGHPDMPEFTFAPDEIDAIIAYLDGLGRPATP